MKTLKKRSLFWDVNLNEIDPDTHRWFIIERILDRGDLEDLKWSKRRYGEESLKKVFLESAGKFNAKTNNFWCLLFGLDKKKCIPKQSIRKQSPFWKR